MSEDNYLFRGTLKDTIRQGSCARLQDISQLQDITIGKPQHRSESSGWLTVIDVKASVLKIIFTVYVPTHAGVKYASLGLGADLKDTTLEMAEDFFSEFCNLTAGCIQSSLQETENFITPVVISLPNTLKSTHDNPGKVEPSQNAANNLNDHWILSGEAGEISCFSSLIIKDTSLVEHLGEVKMPRPPSGDDLGIMIFNHPL